MPNSPITKTIGRQLQTIASFLAPPPPQPYSPSTPPPSGVSPSSYEGLKNDLAEIGDRVKTGLSLFSPKKVVTGISNFASNLFQFDQGDDGFEGIDAVGITDGVLVFVREIANRPECWIDFPLSLQNKEFSMSPVQEDHVMAIQELVPNLTTLKHTVCNHMSERQFWMIYFVLLVPRLNEDDYQLLSTPEIVQVREMVLQKLRNKTNSPTEDAPKRENRFQETESLSETDNATNRMKTTNSEDNVSFSDLDDEGMKQTQSCRFSSASDNSDWVRLGGSSKANRSLYRGRWSESEESSSDWHAVEDVDL